MTETLLANAVRAAMRKLNNNTLPEPPTVDGRLDHVGYEALHDTPHTTTHAHHYHASHVALHRKVTPMPGNRGECEVREADVRAQLQTGLQADAAGHIVIDSLEVQDVVVRRPDGTHRVLTLGTDVSVQYTVSPDGVPHVPQLLDSVYEGGQTLARVVLAGWEKPHRQWCNVRCQPFAWCPMQRDGEAGRKDFCRLLGTYTRMLGHAHLVTLASADDLQAAQASADGQPGAALLVYLHADHGRVQWATNDPQALQTVFNLDRAQDWQDPQTMAPADALPYFADPDGIEPFYLRLVDDGAFESVWRHGRHEETVRWAPDELQVLLYEETPHQRLDGVLHEHAHHGHNDQTVVFPAYGTKPLDVTVHLLVRFYVAVVEARSPD